MGILTKNLAIIANVLRLDWSIGLELFLPSAHLPTDFCSSSAVEETVEQYQTDTKTFLFKLVEERVIMPQKKIEVIVVIEFKKSNQIWLSSYRDYFKPFNPWVQIL